MKKLLLSLAMGLILLSGIPGPVLQQPQPMEMSALDDIGWGG
ncbi:hypothetical protein ACJ7K1_04820 [Paenibacillus elgii]